VQNNTALLNLLTGFLILFLLLLLLLPPLLLLLLRTQSTACIGKVMTKKGMISLASARTALTGAAAA
jgi:ABC-type sulfate transport system permease component